MPSLHVLKGANAGALIPLDGDRFVLGRNPDCDVVIPVPAVNREHAEILRVQGRFFIEDKQSRNHTYVNNREITARTPLRHNDHIRICDFLAAFLEPPADVSGRLRIEALTGPASEGDPKGVQVMAAQHNPVEQECRRLRDALQTNHVFYDRAEVSGLDRQLLDPHSPARHFLGADFHRLLVLDAQAGVDATGVFDLQRFLHYVHDRLAEGFGLHLSGEAFHLETIAQVLKDEPRSLFCFVNLECVPIADLRRLRGFTQELHQALFLCRGPRDIEAEEAPYRVEEEDSESNAVCQPQRDNDLNVKDKITVTQGRLFLGNRPLPPLPQKMSPAQAYRLAALLDFLHRHLALATENVHADEDGTQITVSYAQWQRVMAIQMVLARFARAVAEPETLGE
jgi:pSer/pThr/pTyr-binding forkhead associated (FHA) protein